MKFVCSVCNTIFDTPQEAEGCEKKHSKDSAQEALEAKINEAINLFITRYKRAPKLSLSEEASEIILSDVVESFEEIANALFSSLVAERQDDCDRCRDCHC